MRKLENYTPTRFMAADSTYNKQMADYAVNFIECLCHTKGTWAGKPFELIDWQEQIIRDIFGTLKPNGYRQFNTAYVEIPKKMGKSELAAAVALLLTCGDGEERAEVYGCAADRQQATIVFDVAADMVRMCPALNRRVKILASQKRIVYQPTNSFYQVLSAEAYSKHGFNIHDEIKVAFITLLNKLIYGYRLILTPYLKVLENSSGDEAIHRIQHLEQLIAQNSEQREALTKLMAQGYIDQILYNQETNALLLQAETYRSDIEAITIGMTGDAAKVTETNLLLHFVSHTDMLTAYSEEFFENYADHIEVMSRNEIRFVMKCGLTFTERIDD